MFVQVIQGRAKDAEALRKQMDRWDQDVKPGAAGFLGSTAGVTDDGQFFATARFESEAAARANNDRPEQGEWWEETAQHLDGEATFSEYTDVRESLGGGSDDAGFVQAMQGRSNDPERAKQLEKEFEQMAPQVRPDLIGGFTGWGDDGSFTSVNYFTSEAEARAGESQEVPAEGQEAMKEWQSLFGDIRFVDLKDPWFSSP